MSSFRALHLALATALGLLAGCSGAERAGSPEAQAPGYPDGYRSWIQLRPEAKIRQGEGEAWFFYAWADARVVDGVFAPGSVLVKERRRARGRDVGEPFRVDVMKKSSEGTWQYLAFETDTRRRADVDTEGCALCHGDAAATDHTFIALERLR